MILTRSVVDNLLRNHNIVQVLPEALNYVEQAKAILSRAKQKANCNGCSDRAELGPVSRAFILMLVGLPADRKEVFKQYISPGERVMLYDPREPANMAVLIELK